MFYFLHAKTKQNHDSNISAKYTEKARERAVLRGNQCRKSVVGQGLEPLGERTLYLPLLPTQVPKGSPSACSVSVMGREHVTPYHITKIPWPNRPVLGPSRLHPAESFTDRREAKHLTRHFCFTFVVSNWSWGRISIRFEPVTAFTWLPDTEHHEAHLGKVGMWATQRKDDQEQELVR